MSKKRGFTLVEVLVVIALTTLVFALVGGTFVFLATSSGDLIDKSESIIQAQTIEKHLRSFTVEDNKVTKFQIDKGACLLTDVTFSNNALQINKTKYEDISSFDIFLSDQDNSKEPAEVNKLTSGKNYFVNISIKVRNEATEYTFILGIYQHQ